MIKSYKEHILQNYSIAILPATKMIDGQYPYSRGYDCLSFERILNIKFPDEILFIKEHRLDAYNKYLDNTYPSFRNHINTYEYLSNKGLIPEHSIQVDIRQLRLYQDEINIDRLDKLAIEDNFLKPVLIVKFEEILMLHDGYHRTLISLLNQNCEISGFII